MSQKELTHIWGFAQFCGWAEIGRILNFFPRKRGFGDFNFHSFHFWGVFQRWEGWKGGVFCLPLCRFFNWTVLPPTSTFGGFGRQLWKSGREWKLSIFLTSTFFRAFLPPVNLIINKKSGSREGNLRGVVGGKKYSLAIVPLYVGKGRGA